MSDYSVGSVVFDVKINKKSINSDVKQTGQSIENQFTKSFNSAGRNLENSFKSSFNNIKSGSDSMANSVMSGFKRIGAALLAAFSIQKIKEFGQSAIEQSAKVIAQESALTQTFREYEGVAKSAMQEVGKESGILETRLQSTGTQIFAFAKASGMDSVNALKMMKESLQVTADSAAYYDRSLEDTAESLRSFLKGNYANDAALGVSATETTRNAAANRLYGQSFMELSEAQKQLVLLDMVKQANAASGAMGQAARESEGWENVVGNLKEAWNQLLAAIGRPILQGAIVVIKRLTEWITTLAQWAKAASQALGELFGWSTDTTEQTASNTAQTANSIAESVDNQNALTQAVAKTNAEVKRGVANFDKLNIISRSETSSSNGGSNVNSAKTVGNNNALPIGSIDLDTGNADNKISELKKKLQTVFAPVVAAFNKYIKPIYDKVKKKIDELREKFKDWFDKLNLQPLKDSIEKVMKALEPLADVLLNQVGYVFTEVLLPVGKMFMEQILPTIISLIGDIINTVKPIIEGLGKVLKPIWENILKPALQKITDWFEETGKEIGPELVKLGKKLGELFTELAPFVVLLSRVLGPAIVGILDIIGGHVMQSLTILINTISDIVDALSGLIEFLAGAFTGDWEKAWNGLAKFAYGIVNSIIDGLNQLWAGLYATVASIGNALGGLIKGLGSLLGQEWVWQMPSEAPLIPRLEYKKPYKGGAETSFATGGIVKAPTLAVVGDNPGADSGNPEVISPLNKLQSMIDSSNGEDTVVLSKILEMLKHIYELFVLSRNQGNEYEFVANLNGNDIFREVVRQNELYKKAHNGQGAF